MKHLPKQKRDRLVLIGLGTVLAMVVMWYGLISTSKRQLEHVSKQIVEQRDKVDSAQRLVNSVGELQEKLQTAGAKLKTIEAGMASGDMYSWIITTVNQFRADRKVDIPQFSREVTAEVGILPKFPYKAAIFSVRGTAFFHDLGRFIADFENAFPCLRVQNLELEPAAASSATAGTHPELLTFKMEIVALINPQTL